MYAIFKTVNRTLTKITMKILAAVLLVLLAVFTAFFKAFVFLFRLVALPLCTIGVIAAGYFYFNSGFCTEFYWIVAGVVVAAAAYFTFPLIPPVLDYMKDCLKDYVTEPLFIRSPVKYTM